MAAPIRVAHIMGKMVGGGVEQVVMNYYRHIDRSRVQFDFIVDSDSTLVPKEEIESLGGRVYAIPPYSRPFAYQRSLQSLCREQSWKIVHSHINSLSVFPLRAAKKAGVPIRIAHSHSASGRGEPLRNAVKTILKTQANRYPTNRFACSSYAGKWLFGQNVPFEIICNAIELDRFDFDPDVRREVRSELGISDNELVVLHVGRFASVKNHKFLIDVFYRLLGPIPNSVLLLAGTGKIEKQVRDLTNMLGITEHVRFLGQRDDVERLYMAADVFVLPSLYEGLGLVGIEAQASGLPCLLSDRVPPEVNVAGMSVFLPIDDPSIWVEAILKSTKVKHRQKRGPAFREYDISFASRTLVDRYEQLVVEVADDQI